MTSAVATSAVPCLTCGKPHAAYQVDPSPAAPTWADPGDGHTYRPMTAREITERYKLVPK